MGGQYEKKNIMVAFLKTAVFLSARKIMLTAGYFLQLPSIIYIPAELFCTFRNKVSIWLQVWCSCTVSYTYCVQTSSF